MRALEMEERGLENRKMSPMKRQKSSRKPNAMFHIIKVANVVPENKVQNGTKRESPDGVKQENAASAVNLNERSVRMIQPSQ